METSNADQHACDLCLKIYDRSVLRFIPGAGFVSNEVCPSCRFAFTRGYIAGVSNSSGRG